CPHGLLRSFGSLSQASTDESSGRLGADLRKYRDAGHSQVTGCRKPGFWLCVRRHIGSLAEARTTMGSPGPTCLYRQDVEEDVCSSGPQASSSSRSSPSSERSACS